MKRIKRHKIVCFMLVVMMTILALLPHMSWAMEQNFSEGLVVLEEVQSKSAEDESNLGLKLADIELEPADTELESADTELEPANAELEPADTELESANAELEPADTELESADTELKSTDTEPEPSLLRSLEASLEDEESDGLIAHNATELLRVFTHGDTRGGISTWSGERIVYLAFEDLGYSIATIAPPAGTERVVILRSLDGGQRNLTSFPGDYATHFQIGRGNRLILDDENLHIVGHSTDEKVAGTAGGGLRVDNGGTFELRRGTIRHITSSWFNSPIIVSPGGTFIMKGGQIRNNRANAGGAIMVNGGLFELFDGTISNNYALQYGGGLEVANGGTLNMYDGAIRDNHAQWYGGGLELNLLSTFNMYGGAITGNTAAGDGGGGLRVNIGSLFNMFDGLIDGNKVTSDGRFPYGGGVAIYSDSTFNMNGGTISNNISHRGGGVAAWEGIFNLGTGRTTAGRAPANQTGAVGSPVIIGNTATGGGQEHTTMVIGYGGGGGVMVYGKSNSNGNANFIMHSGLITENTTAYRGGGVFLNTAEFQMRGGEISNNKTTENDSEHAGGGGVYLHENNWLLLPANFTMTGGVIRDNFSRNGGGIARNNNALPIGISGDSLISGNIAQRLGGGIYTHTPAAESAAINGLNIGQNRGNFTTASTVRFEKNRSLLPLSRGLTVGQVRTNNAPLYGSVQWLGKNSTSGQYNNDPTFHLFNNHDVSNLQGTPITEEYFDVYQVIEKHVDIYGMPIDERRDVQLTFANGDPYQPTPPILEGYEAVGYKWELAPGPSGDDFEFGSPEEILVNGAKTIYFVYKEKGTDVIIIKMVSGELASKVQPFNFTVYLTDKGNKPLNKGSMFDYAGGVLYQSGGPVHDNGVLVLDEEGKGTISLSHGQIVRIMDLPKDTGIRIVEEEDVNYLVSYIDYAEESPVTGNDTKEKVIGAEERVFEFVNTRYQVLPLGIKVEAKEAEMALYAGIACACPVLLLLGIGLYNRRKVDSINYW